jgi:Raf kinase inhibitor-like YbhB/YbcL family protein
MRTTGKSDVVRAAWWVVTGALVLAAAGCGGDDDAAAGAPSGGAQTITVNSPAFGNGDDIPVANTCRGDGAAPEIGWRGVPKGAESVALVVTDPDAPGGTFVHWVLYDLPPRDRQLGAGQEPPAGTHEAANSGGGTGWTPPCPPSGTHHYQFTVYALNAEPSGDSTDALLADIGRKAIARGQLVGLVSASSG